MNAKRPSIFSILLLLGIGVIWASVSSRADGIGAISRTNKRLQAAEEAFKKKDFRNAIRSYEEAFRENPDLPAQARLNLAHACYQEKRDEAAQKHYLTASANLTSPALRSVAFQQIGNLFSRKKDYKGALEWYKKSLIANPSNAGARFNYELAYKLSRKKEAEQNPPGNPEKNPENKSNPKKEGGQNKSDPKNGKQGEGKEDPAKSDPSKKGDSKQESKGSGPKGKEQDNKPGKEQPGEETRQADQKQGGGQEEKPDESGQESNRNQDKESNMDDPDAIRMDRKKLQEAGLTEDQAKTLLKAMRQNEVKYLQQRRFRSLKGGQTKNSPRW